MRKSYLALLVMIILFGGGYLLLRNRGGNGDGGRAFTFVNIGTGGVTGVYYQVGGVIMQLMEKKLEVYGIKLSSRATGGSVYNINSVLSGSLDFGLSQSDRQYQAWKGLGEWQNQGPQKELRSVCSFHPEIVTLVAADDANIRTLMDLKGKRVNIGNPGSGQRGNALEIFRMVGLDPEKDFHAEGVKAAESSKLLQDGRIDAFFYTVGHPAGAIIEACAGRRTVHFVPITGVDELLKKYPYYTKATISASLYPQASNREDTLTVGVMTTLVTAAKTPDQVVYAVTKEIFENLAEFKRRHPAFARLTKERMLEGLSAPIHPGAMKYYREVGLIQVIQGDEKRTSSTTK